VSAVVLDDGTRSYLSLTNRETGHPFGTAADDALKVTQTLTGTTGTALFPGDASVPSAPTVIRASAENARLTVDGLAIERTSNAVDDVIPGATLTLQAPSAQEAGAWVPENLVLVENKEGTRARLDTFVNAYNALVQSMRTLNAPGDGAAGLLSGDGIARNLQADLEGAISRTVGNGALSTLADIGIALQRDGTLEVDDDAFSAALAKNPHALDRLFAHETEGLGRVVDALVKRYADKEKGLLTLRSKGVQETIDRLSEDIEKQKAHLEKFRETLVRQFTALESTVAKFNSIADFLKMQEAAREQNK
jgi:flagellar hook-associated protein 2